MEMGPEILPGNSLHTTSLVLCDPPLDLARPRPLDLGSRSILIFERFEQQTGKLGPFLVG